MKITAMVVGRAGAPLKDAILEYETRAGRWNWKFKVTEVASGHADGGHEGTWPGRKLTRIV